MRILSHGKEKIGKGNKSEQEANKNGLGGWILRILKSQLGVFGGC
jgi:hypothetical protein